MNDEESGRERTGSIVPAMLRLSLRRKNSAKTQSAEPKKRVSSFVNPLYHQMPGEEIKEDPIDTKTQTPPNSLDEESLDNKIKSIRFNDTLSIKASKEKKLPRDSKKIILKKHGEKNDEKQRPITSFELSGYEEEDKNLKEKPNVIRCVSIDENNFNQIKSNLVDQSQKSPMKRSPSSGKSVKFFDEQNIKNISEKPKVKHRLMINSFLEGQVFEETIPIELARNREAKWIEMIKDIENFKTKNPQKLKERCRKGIPVGIRFQTWPIINNLVHKITNNSNYFDECSLNLNKFDLEIYNEKITQDLDTIGCSKETKTSLIAVLKAFAVHASINEYSIQYRYIVNVLVSLLPNIDSFYMLIHLHDTYLKDYYASDKKMIETDASLLAHLLKKEYKLIYEMLNEVDFDYNLIIEDWFMNLFSSYLPLNTILRVWDMFFCEGFKVLYRLAIYLIKTALNNKEVIESCRKNGSEKVVEYLRNVNKDYLKADHLVKGLLEVEIFTSDLSQPVKGSKRKN